MRFGFSGQLCLSTKVTYIYLFGFQNGLLFSQNILTVFLIENTGLRSDASFKYLFRPLELFNFPITANSPPFPATSR